MATAFEYKTRFGELDPSQEEIRLLSVAPTTNDDVQCDVVTVSMNDQPNYQALSYVWGDATKTIPLRVGDSMLSITTNLKQALLHVSRLPNRCDWLWVDAICINQKDNDEKSSQVAFMREIYNKATSVLAWLGPADADSTKAMQSLEILGKAILHGNIISRFPTAYMKNQKERAYLQDFFKRIDYGLEASHDIALAPICALTKREWWKRLWTFQEVVLSRDAIILCGSNSIRAVVFDGAIHGIRILSKLEFSYEMSNILKEILSTCLYVIYIWTAYCFPEGSDLRQSLEILELLGIISVQGRNCSDPRDRIYGLLGIAQDAIARQIRIDYNKSVATLYTEVAKMLISHHGLDVLAYCQIPINSAQECVPSTSGHVEYSTYTEEVQHPNLEPSWVPNWHAELIVPIHNRRDEAHDLGRMEFRASKCIDVEDLPVTFHSNRILKCMGLVLDEVRVTLAPPNQKSSPIEWFEAIASLTANSEIYKSASEKENALRRTPCADQVSDRARGTMRRVTETDIESCTQFVDTYPTWSPGTLPADMLNYAQVILMNISYGRLVYATKRGYLGLGPRGIRPGDIVCILSTAAAPYVLRKVYSDYYTLVGESYVHGVMDGEYKPAKSELRHFMIV